MDMEASRDLAVALGYGLNSVQFSHSVMSDSL